MIQINEINKTGESVYKSIWTATQAPFRTFAELQKFMASLATNKVTLKTLHDKLRIDIQNEKKDMSYNITLNDKAFPRDIEICRDAAKRGYEAIESIEAWYLLAERHKTLNTLEANNWPRMQAVELLNKDIRPLCTFGYEKQFKPAYELKKDIDYIYFIMPFLKNGKQTQELYESIFGHSYVELPEKLYLRMTDILYKSENSGLTRTESQEFADSGFTRECITRYFEVLFDLMNKESNTDLKGLFEEYINDCYSDLTIKQHIPII